jgi:putative DNA primase/helicase
MAEAKKTRVPSRGVVLAKAKGRWVEIMEELAPSLKNAIDAGGTHVPCPHPDHASSSDGFRLFNDFPVSGGGVCNTCGTYPYGLLLLEWLSKTDRNPSGKPPEQIRQEVMGVLRGIDQGEIRRQERRKAPVVFAPKIDPVQAQRGLDRVMDRMMDIRGTPAERYLLKRGIYQQNMADILRFHPLLPYYDSKTKELLGEFPAMLAPVTNAEGKLVSIHRTFITPEGDKAPVPDAKRLMPGVEKLNGAAIKLFPCTEVLGVGEGIETMLAVHAITRLPVWSCVSAGLLEEVSLPLSVRHVVIWADKDAKGRGQEAAETLAERVVKEHRSVEVVYPGQAIPPDEKGLDWLDVLVQYGEQGFPPRWRGWSV